ncbi:twin-arginine translocase subunit TatC [Corynebacterium sp. CCM 8862]|uniref:Sec-independent protein translocase protein TatC n=2 Tax=Corynebacterium mendelii TaxID=2765362 RepID=A0A939DYT3_9CORY|nr:twin-arginine translocase subunit TatC [Corynebacterium mendelii]
MSLVEHLQELRRRVIVSVAALCVGTIIGYIWYAQGVHIAVGAVNIRIPTLGDILRGPYCDIPPERRADFSADGECKLLATAPFDMFMLRLKAGALAGAVFSSPVWLGQLWGFITPGLMKNEKRISRIFISLAVLLFTAGAVLAYFIVSVGLSFLLSIGQDTQTTALNGMLYFKFLLTLLVIFGISFEVPLIVVMLNILGLLPYEAVRDKRRIIIVVLFCFAAVATPGQDPFSMLVLGLVLCLLVELAFQFCRINDRRRTVNRPEWLDVDDTQASRLDSAATGAGGVQPIEPAQPLGPVQPVRPGSYGSAAAQPPGLRRGGQQQPGPGDFDDVV